MPPYAEGGPTARVEEIIDRLGGAKFITMLDMTQLNPIESPLATFIAVEKGENKSKQYTPNIHAFAIV